LSHPRRSWAGANPGRVDEADAAAPGDARGDGRSEDAAASASPFSLYNGEFARLDVIAAVAF
jgi:hypothetical protein